MEAQIHQASNDASVQDDDLTRKCDGRTGHVCSKHLPRGGATAAAATAVVGVNVFRHVVVVVG